MLIIAKILAQVIAKVVAQLDALHATVVLIAVVVTEVAAWDVTRHASHQLIVR